MFFFLTTITVTGLVTVVRFLNNVSLLLLRFLFTTTRFFFHSSVGLLRGGVLARALPVFTIE